MLGSIHLSGERLERTVANATACDDCEVVGVDLAGGSGERFDLCRRHYWELVIGSREAVEGTADGEPGEDPGEGDDRRVNVSSVDRTALGSFGVDLDPGATSVSRNELATLDAGEVAAAVPDDPDAVRVLGLLAAVDPGSVAEHPAAVEACLPIVEAWENAAAGASRVLGNVAAVDPDVARSLLSAAATDDVPFHVARAIRTAVGRDAGAMRSLRTDDGDSLLVETVAEAGRSGATSAPLFHVALLLAREDPGAFVDHADAFLAPLDATVHHPEGAATAFEAAATLGYVATVDPATVDELREDLLATGSATHPHPETEAILRAAGAVAFAHSPALADRASVDVDWLRDRLTAVIDRLDVEGPVRSEAVTALGRFADADDREYLEWVAEGSDGAVARAARRAADGEFRVEWPERLRGSASTDADPNSTPGLDAVPADPDWDVPAEYAVAFAAFEALGASPEGSYDPAAEQWTADWTAPLALLSPAHDLGVLDLGTAVDLDAVALALGPNDATYDPDHLPFLGYEAGSGGDAVFLSAAGVAVYPRLADPDAGEAAFRDLLRELDAAGVADAADAEAWITSVGTLLDRSG